MTGNFAARRIESPKLAGFDIDPVEALCIRMPDDAFAQDVPTADDQFGLLHPRALQGQLAVVDDKPACLFTRVSSGGDTSFTP